MLLLRVTADIEQKFETEKWAQISDGIVAAGGARFTSTALHKRFKDLTKEGKAMA